MKQWIPKRTRANQDDVGSTHDLALCPSLRKREDISSLARIEIKQKTSVARAKLQKIHNIFPHYTFNLTSFLSFIYLFLAVSTGNFVSAHTFPVPRNAKWKTLEINIILLASLLCERASGRRRIIRIIVFLLFVSFSFFDPKIIHEDSELKVVVTGRPTSRAWLRMRCTRVYPNGWDTNRAHKIIHLANATNYI